MQQQSLPLKSETNSSDSIVDNDLLPSIVAKDVLPSIVDNDLLPSVNVL